MVEKSILPFRRELKSDGTTESEADAPRIAEPASHFWASAFAADSEMPHAYLLLMRFALVNLAGFALLAAAWFQGWILIVHHADSTYQSHGIAALFLVGLAICAQKVWRTSVELNKVKRFDPFHPEPSLALKHMAQIRGRDASSRGMAASALKLKLSSRIAAVRFIANMLVILGLIGTVVGFIMALAGVNPETSADASAIGPMVSTLISGMSVALYTTLIGSVLNIWLMVNYQILVTGTVNLMTGIVELGEIHNR
ncbi:MAG: MotA/TolQ/ExbB proton channel family protein [Dongiaceae bacterium]